MEASNYLVSWFITYLQDLQPTYTGIITHVLSTMDIPVIGSNLERFPQVSRIQYLGLSEKGAISPRFRI